jgi:predicted transcriptional regulator
MAKETALRACRYCGGSGEEFDPILIGREMREIRERAGLSLRHMGKMLMRSAMYLSDCERGNRCFTQEMVAKYRKVLK